MLCFKKFLAAKKFMDKKGGVSRYSVEKFLSHSAEKSRRGILESFINFGYRRSLDERVVGGRVSRFSVENFLSHSAEKTRRATLLCCVSEKFRQPKIYGQEGGGEEEGSITIFVENFLFTVPKIFVREPFRVSLISGIEKVYA